MKYKLYLTLLILFALPLSAFEITLDNGDAFICDLITETDKSFKILFKGKEYTIPKTDVVATDSTKKGTHSSFRYSRFVLKDGSKLNGVIAEENAESFTLKTELGFLVVEKSRIAEFPSNTKTPPDLSSTYLSANIRLPETRVGIFGSGFLNTAPISSTNPISTGGGIYAEPAFLNWRSFSFGFRSEYLQSLSGNNTITFFNNSVYMHRNRVFLEKPMLDFYVNFGLTASNVSYKKGTESFSGVNPGSYLELGWQGIKFKNMYIRLGLNTFCNFESQGVFCAGGGTLGLGVRF
ncbi:MAG: hypothetical protein IPL26_10140 [Leptospiraceae bacterium]|nr:hypothetical protein [Leptospiraceae bacterium]